MKYPTSPTKLFAATITLALAGTFAVAATAAPGGPGMGGQGPMWPVGMGHAGMAGMGHGGMMGQGPMFGGMFPQMLDRVNATPEQRAQIRQIMDNHASEMRAQREAGRALRDQAMVLFTQPTVNADAVEALRQKQMAMHDAASKRMTLALLEVSRVLTPEQRKQLAEQMTQRRDMMQRHQRERQSLDTPKS
jgi:Spy/CpxP family protein refolding chaperone